MKRAFTLIEAMVVLLIVGILAAILYPVFYRGGGYSPRSSCQSNMKQISLGILQYAQDYHEKMPLLAIHTVASSSAPFAKPYGWADAIHPYVKSTQVFQCPSERTTLPATDAVQSGFTDYYFNTTLARVEQRRIENPVKTLMLGEGNDGRDGSDARYNRNVLPQHWLNDATSPANRHTGGANYAFADGHVKWFKAELIARETASGGKMTFALR